MKKILWEYAFELIRNDSRATSIHYITGDKCYWCGLSKQSIQDLVKLIDAKSEPTLEFYGDKMYKLKATGKAPMYITVQYKSPLTPQTENKERYSYEHIKRLFEKKRALFKAVLQ